MKENWRIFKEFTFEAAHKLPHHTGKCQRLHGHSWRGRVYIESSELCTNGSMRGMVYDFSDLSKNYIKPLLQEYLDHHYLNESLQLESPTCEEVARWIYKKLSEQELPGLSGVEILETCTSGVFYTQNNDES